MGGEVANQMHLLQLTPGSGRVGTVLEKGRGFTLTGHPLCTCFVLSTNPISHNNTHHLLMRKPVLEPHGFSMGFDCQTV